MSFTERQNLITARLFEKGVRDGLSGINADSLTFKVEAIPFGHRGAVEIVITVEKTYLTERIRLSRAIKSTGLEGQDGSGYGFGKALGLTMGQRYLEEICKRQPQEVTISLKDLDKAREADLKVAKQVKSVEAFANTFKSTGWTPPHFPVDDHF